MKRRPQFVKQLIMTLLLNIIHGLCGKVQMLPCMRCQHVNNSLIECALMLNDPCQCCRTFWISQKWFTIEPNSCIQNLIYMHCHEWISMHYVIQYCVFKAVWKGLSFRKQLISLNLPKFFFSQLWGWIFFSKKVFIEVKVWKLSLCLLCLVSSNIIKSFGFVISKNKSYRKYSLPLGFVLLLYVVS